IRGRTRGGGGRHALAGERLRAPGQPLPARLRTAQLPRGAGESRPLRRKPAGL
ncbi:MAG: Aspartate aminotransferase, partial [uncultured Rubrobacteraceae bacterium]